MAHLLYLLFVVSVLVVLFTTDIVDGLLPNVIILPASAVVAAYKLYLLIFSDLVSVSVFFVDLAAAFLVSSIFFAIVYLSRERAMGGGDPKLVFLLGLAFGWPFFLVALFAGFLTGGLVAVMLILVGRKRFGQTVPLGPFLITGAFMALFWGQQIIDFYLKFLYT